MHTGGLQEALQNTRDALDQYKVQLRESIILCESIFYILYFIFYILYFIFYILYFIFYILYFIFYILNYCDFSTYNTRDRDNLAVKVELQIARCEGHERAKPFFDISGTLFHYISIISCSNLTKKQKQNKKNNIILKVLLINVA